jgi:hypothetical protein
MILFSYAFLVFAARGVVIGFFGNESRVEFFIPEGGCWDVSTMAVGMYSIFSSPYFLLTVSTKLNENGAFLSWRRQNKIFLPVSQRNRMADVFLRTSLAAPVPIEHSTTCLVRRYLPTQIWLRKRKNRRTMDFSRQNELRDLAMVTKSSISPKLKRFYQFPRLCAPLMYT